MLLVIQVRQGYKKGLCTVSPRQGFCFILNSINLDFIKCLDSLKFTKILCVSLY